MDKRVALSRLLFVLALVPGTLAGIWGSWLLFALGIALAFCAVRLDITSARDKAWYLFAGVFLVCLPFDLHMIMLIADVLFEEGYPVAILIAYGFLALSILISVQEILLGTMGYLLWRRRDKHHVNEY